MSYKPFALVIIGLFIGMMFQAPVVKAQDDMEIDFFADFPAQEIPQTEATFENNLAEPDEVRTELGEFWEQDLGKQVTDGSYVGAILQSSLFELEYEPYMKNKTGTYTAIEYNLNNHPLHNFTWSDNPIENQWIVDYYHGALPVPPINPTFYASDFDNATLSFIVRENIEKDIEVAEKRSILTISTQMRFSNRMIMNGASEFWVKIPIKPDCISWEMNPTLAFYDVGQSNATYSDLNMKGTYGIFYDFNKYRLEFNTTTGEPYQVLNDGNQIITGAGSVNELMAEYNGNEPEILQLIKKDDVVGDSLYKQVRASIIPNRNYIVSFSCILERKPLVYLTEEDITSNGRLSNFKYTDMDFQLASTIDGNAFDDWGGAILQSNGYPKRETKRVVTSQYYTGNSYINESINLECDMAWSFVFKNGMGAYGMFGKEMHFEPDDALVFYKELPEVTKDTFISVMLPFISENDILVNISAELVPIGKNIHPVSVVDLDTRDYYWNLFEGRLVNDATIYNLNVQRSSPFDLGNTTDKYVKTNYWTADTNRRFTDYILFTIPYKADYRTMLNAPETIIKIQIVFMEEADLTLMFSTLDKSDMYETVKVPIAKSTYYEGIVNNGYGRPQYNVRYNLAYVYRDTNIEAHYVQAYPDNNIADYSIYPKPNFEFDGWIDYRRKPEKIDDCEVYHYELFSSVQFTDGIWSQYVTTPSGLQFATHYYERRIAVGIVDLWVDTTAEEWRESRFWWYGEEWQQAQESLEEGDILGALYHMMALAISDIWNGLASFVGTIVGVFGKIWDGLVSLGSFIWNSLSSFVGGIFSFVGNIVDGITILVQVGLYILAIFIFMYIVGKYGDLLKIGRKADV